MKLSFLLKEIAGRGFLFNVGHVVVITATIYLGLLAYNRNPENKNNRSFLFLNITFALWTLSMYLSDFLFIPYPILLVICRFTWGFGYIVAFSILNFSIVFPEEKKELPRYYHLTLVGCIILFLVGTFTPLIASDISIINRLDRPFLITKNGPLMNLTILYAVIAIAGLVKLFRKRKHVKGKQKAQLQYLFLGISLFVLYIFATDVIPQLFGIAYLARYGALGMILIVGFVAHAIITYRLMDIRALISRLIAYTITLSLLIAFYLSSIELIYIKYQPIKSSENILAILLLGSFVLLFNSLRKIVEKNTEKIIFRKHYSFQELISKISGILNRRNLNMSELASLIMACLVEDMKVEGASFIFPSNPRKRVEALGFSSRFSPSFLEKLKLLDYENRLLVYEELEVGSKKWQLLKEANAQILMPIRTEEKLEAILVLGSKKNEDIYSAQDLNLLEMLSTQLAQAFENARLFETVSEDAINSVYKHKAFLELLVNEFSDAKRSCYHMALILININSFDKIKAKYGLKTSTQLISQTQELVEKSFEDLEVTSRHDDQGLIIGNMILPQDINSENANEWLAKTKAIELRDIILSNKFTDNKIRIKVCIGFLIFDGKTNISISHLIEEVDNLILKVKNDETGSINFEILKRLNISVESDVIS